jgi:hypothetical protein
MVHSGGSRAFDRRGGVYRGSARRGAARRATRPRERKREADELKRQHHEEEEDTPQQNDDAAQPSRIAREDDVTNPEGGHGTSLAGLRRGRYLRSTAARQSGELVACRSRVTKRASLGLPSEYREQLCKSVRPFAGSSPESQDPAAGRVCSQLGDHGPTTPQSL